MTFPHDLFFSMTLFGEEKRQKDKVHIKGEKNVTGDHILYFCKTCIHLFFKS